MQIIITGVTFAKKCFYFINTTFYNNENNGFIEMSSQYQETHQKMLIDSNRKQGEWYIDI